MFIFVAHSRYIHYTCVLSHLEISFLLCDVRKLEFDVTAWLYQCKVVERINYVPFSSPSHFAVSKIIIVKLYISHMGEEAMDERLSEFVIKNKLLTLLRFLFAQVMILSCGISYGVNACKATESD